MENSCRHYFLNKWITCATEKGKGTKMQVHKQNKSKPLKRVVQKQFLSQLFKSVRVPFIFPSLKNEKRKKTSMILSTFGVPSEI